MKYLILDYLNRHRSLFIAIIIFGFFANIPFIFQAFHIDDSLNIYLARNILKNPLNPYDFTMVYNGAMQKFYQFYANPPFNGYLLALMLLIFGENEIPLHLFHMVYSILAGIFMFLISKKFLIDERKIIASTILLLISPAVFVMSHTIMPDMALLVFYLAAIYFFLEAGDKGKPFLYILAGIFAGIASLTRYSGLTLILLFLFCIFIRDKKRNTMAYLSILIPLAVFYLWYKWAVFLYSPAYWSGIFSLETAQNKVLRMAMHLLANITYLGGAAIFPLSLLNVINRANIKAMWGLFVASGVASSYFSILLYKNYSHTLGQSLLFFIFCFCFISFLVKSFGYIKPWLVNRSKNVLLIFWMLLLIVFNSIFLHTAVKYNLLIIPPVILIFMILLKESPGKKYFNILTATLVLTFFLSLSVAFGDMKFADIYKNLSKKLYYKYKKDNNTVYYVGHWGWEYYMEKLGAKPILSFEMNQILKGDIIVMPFIPWPQPLPANLKDEISVCEKVVVNDKFPIRTMNGWAKAFFYANYNFPNFQGVLPYSFSFKTPLEIFLIFKTKP